MGKRKLLILFSSICLVLTLVALPFVTSCAAPAPPAEAKTYKIGFLAGLTGFGSASLKVCWEGAQLAQDWINDQGGITVDGQQYLIELIAEDTKGTADGTVAAATKLIYDYDLKFIAGTVMPYIVEAAGTVTEPAGVLRSLLYNCGMPSEYGPTTPYTFLSHNASVEGSISGLTYLTEAYPEVKTIVIVIPDDGSIPYLGPIVKRNAEERGLTVLGDFIGWPHDIVDFAPIATKALARDPDAICMMNGWPACTGSILKAAREQGYTKPVFGCNYDPAHDIREVAGVEASTNFFIHGLTPGDPAMTPMVNEISTLAEAKFGVARPLHFLGFNGVWCLTQAIEAAQSFEPDVVRDTWEKMETMETVYGTGRMGGLETYGIKHTVCHPIAIHGLVDGEVKHLKWVEVYTP